MARAEIRAFSRRAAPDGRRLAGGVLVLGLLTTLGMGIYQRFHPSDTERRLVGHWTFVGGIPPRASHLELRADRSFVWESEPQKGIYEILDWSGHWRANETTCQLWVNSPLPFRRFWREMMVAFFSTGSLNQMLFSELEIEGRDASILRRSGDRTGLIGMRLADDPRQGGSPATEAESD